MYLFSEVILYDRDARNTTTSKPQKLPLIHAVNLVPYQGLQVAYPDFLARHNRHAINSRWR